MRIISLLGPLLLVVAEADGQNSCLSEGRCSSGETTLSIRDCGFTDEDIPDLVACFDSAGRGTIETIFLSDNDLTTLPQDLFDGFEALLHLDLEQNNLVLQSGNFKGATALEELSLLGNQMTVLAAGSFEGLTSLRELNLAENQLTFLAQGLEGMPSLTKLNLVSNELMSVDAGIFVGTTSLEDLDLGDNALTTLTAGIFDGIEESLLHLRLSLNNLDTLPADLFNGMINLDTLYLDANGITSLPESLFENTPAMRNLELSDNRLTAVPSGLFKGLASMETLTFLLNDIATFPADIFDDLSSLLYLDCSKNQLTTLPAGLFNRLPALEALSLGQNPGLQCIPAIPDFTSFDPEVEEFEEPPFCDCPESPTCDEDGLACECQPGELGYSCVGSSSEITRAFVCPSSDLVDAAERTTVTVEASAFDERTSDSGCGPDGCTPENTRDTSLDANSRWSCKGDLVEGNGGCCIDYSFEEPQDIVSLDIAFHRGTDRTRTLDVYENGDFHSQIESSGSTNELEEFVLNSDETADLTLCLDDSKSGSEWLSITEVKFMVL